MRPRHKAAENALVSGVGRILDLASMRPRHKAAENVMTMLNDSLPVEPLQ